MLQVGKYVVVVRLSQKQAEVKCKIYLEYETHGGLTDLKYILYIILIYIYVIRMHEPIYTLLYHCYYSPRSWEPFRSTS